MYFDIKNIRQTAVSWKYKPFVGGEAASTTQSSGHKGLVEVHVDRRAFPNAGTNVKMMEMMGEMI